MPKAGRLPVRVLLSPDQYTPRRMAIMTTVVWGLFASTLGLAAWAARYPAKPRTLEFREVEQPDRIQRNLRRMITTQPG